MMCREIASNGKAVTLKYKKGKSIIRRTSKNGTDFNSPVTLPEQNSIIRAQREHTILNKTNFRIIALYSSIISINPNTNY